MVIALLVMAFLLGYSVWSLFKLDSEIAKFTSPAAKPVPVANLAGAEAALNGLKARLEVFRTGMEADPPRPATLSLSPEDINRAIAAFDEFRDLRGTLHITAMKEGRMEIDICFPMHGRPFSGESRFLNARMTARPELQSGEVVLQVDELRVPGAEVPSEFLGHFSPYRVLERYREHPQLGPAMRRLTGVEIKDGTLVLRAIPGESPPSAITDEQVDTASSRLLRWLGMAVGAFLLLAGGIAAIVVRRRIRVKRIDEEPRL
jgi:hypothetical protein